MISLDPARWLLALLLLLGWLGLCLPLFAAWRSQKNNPPGTDNLHPQHPQWLVLYASQTGNAALLAQQTRDQLQGAGLHARCLCLSQADGAVLAAARQVLFIVSTYGEGDAPDDAARFVFASMSQPASLAHLDYAVLALGDRSYSHFCGFGRRLASWLQASGARALFPLLEADRCDNTTTARWRQHIGNLAGDSGVPEQDPAPFESWRLLARDLLNPGSLGGPVYHIRLQPRSGALPHWEAGDLVQISAPAEPDAPRSYSIASVTAEGQISLLVRLHQRVDGSSGTASGWLCHETRCGDPIHLRLRAHPRFRLGANLQRPLICIGNGTGLAGMRAHLKTRIDDGRHDNWLIFGERQAAHDYLQRDELQRWQQQGQLAELDCCFSRDPGALRYVQHALAAHAARVRDWVDRGAAIYVCGSLQGMASDVHSTLQSVLGATRLAQLQADGRYRRDVY